MYSSKDNVNLAYYLNNEEYKELDKFGVEDHDDYFRITAVNALKNKKSVRSDLDMLAKQVEGAFYSEQWDSVKANTEKNHDYLFSIDKPVLIETYKPNSEIITEVVLMKLKTGDREIISIMTLNLIIIKERLITLGYIKDYDGVESIKKTKSKNDFIVLRLLDENK